MHFGKWIQFALINERDISFYFKTANKKLFDLLFIQFITCIESDQAQRKKKHTHTPRFLCSVCFVCKHHAYLCQKYAKIVATQCTILSQNTHKTSSRKKNTTIWKKTHTNATRIEREKKIYLTVNVTLLAAVFSNKLSIMWVCIRG